MKLNRTGLRRIILEEMRNLKEIRASGIPGDTMNAFPDIPITDLTSIGHPPQGSMGYVEPDETSDLDSDGDEDDVREMIDMLYDLFSEDQIETLKYMLNAASHEGDDMHHVAREISRRYGGDPKAAMQHLVTG